MISSHADPLIDYLSARVALTEKDKEIIASSYRPLSLKKKEHLFKHGEVCPWEGFILSGTFRVYYLDAKGLEHVLYFGFNDWWISDIASFYGDTPATLNAQAMEDSEILVIDRVMKEKLFATVPVLERLFRLITQKHLTVLQRRFLLTVSETAEERYKALLKRSPGIEQLVPQHQIASYLGILPESLSRMKKQRRKDQ